VSNINYTRINENFPVAGQDNDTQVFRDNFDTIKTSLRVAQEEITALEDPTTGAARLNRDNDFNKNVIQNAVLQNNIEKTTTSIEVPIEGATVNTATIDFENGHYQLFRITESTVIFDFLNFPVTAGVGKVTVEFTSSNGLLRTIIFSDHFTSVTTIDPYLDNYDENDITCQYISLNEVYLKFLDNTKNNTNIKLIKNESFPNIAFNVDGSYFDVGTLSGYRDLINRLEL
jgi:hypothetical protein